MRKNPARLAELKRLMILDSAPERDYDAITSVLAHSLGVPIAMVNLLDGDRDWFKSCVGLDMRESPAATSFCESFFGTAEDLIVVPDTARDARFQTHPLVIAAPFIRFYAAARLCVGGQTVGTLCAYDLQPRHVLTEQVGHMQTLASAVVDLLRQRARVETRLKAA